MSRISINDLCNSPEPIQLGEPPTEDIAIAVQALESLQSHSLSNPNQVNTEEHFISRVSNIPIVNSALKAYEQTKANNVYSAETVESSVKTLCRPVINKLEPQLDQLDKFACRTLDKIEKHYTTIMINSNSEQSLSEESYIDEEASISGKSSKSDSDTNKKRRSGWKSVVVEAGMYAGAGAGFVNEESIKGIKYCIEFLKYAIAHIQQQINVAGNYLIHLSNISSQSIIAANNEATNYIVSIKKEVIITLRKVVDVIGRYAGAYLPGDARNSVKGFILSLPGRWASLSMPNLESTISTPCTSPLLTPSSTSYNSPNVMTPKEEAHRVVILATESLNMLQNVYGIFSDTMQRAERSLKSINETDQPNLSISNTFSSLPPSASDIAVSDSNSQDNHPNYGTLKDGSCSPMDLS